MGVINNNLKRIVDDLLENGYKITFIAKSMGYTTTTQIKKSMQENTVVTSTALEKFISVFNINPEFLFTGEGKMYNIIDESGIAYVIYHIDNKVYQTLNGYDKSINCARIYTQRIIADFALSDIQNKYRHLDFPINLAVKKILIKNL
jgi:hypothetical protein